MVARMLSGMELKGNVIHKLAARNLHTAKDVLGKTELELVELLDVNLDDLREALHAISRHVAPKCNSVLELLNERVARSADLNHLPTQLEALDEALYGGLPFGTITELVGAAGVGKTQFCFMLSLFATLPKSHGGLDGSVVYVDTEKKFSSLRFVEIAQTRFPEEFSDANETAIQELTSRVFVVTPNSASDLLKRLNALEEIIIERHVRLIVVDSIAALLRSETEREKLIQNHELLGRQAAILKYLAEKFRVSVVVTNQVTTRIGGAAGQANFDFVRSARDEDGRPMSDNSEAYLTAALGTKWAHCVNIRLVLEILSGQRFLKIAKSPMAAALAFPYAITAAGIQLTSDEVYDAEDGLSVIRNESGCFHQI